jgi:hypothetical protein
MNGLFVVPPQRRLSSSVCLNSYSSNQQRHVTTATVENRRKLNMPDEAQTENIGPSTGDRGSYNVIMINCASHKKRQTRETWHEATASNDGTRIEVISPIGDGGVFNAVERKETRGHQESILQSTLTAQGSAAVENVKDLSESMSAAKVTVTQNAKRHVSFVGVDPASTFFSVCMITKLQIRTKPPCQPADDLKEVDKTCVHVAGKVNLHDDQEDSRSFPAPAFFACRKYFRHSIRLREQYHRQQLASTLSWRSRMKHKLRRNLPLEAAEERRVRRAWLEEARYQRLPRAVARKIRIRKMAEEDNSLGTSLSAPMQVSCSS